MTSLYLIIRADTHALILHSTRRTPNSSYERKKFILEDAFTSELNKYVNLLVKNLLELRGVGVHVIIHLLSHLQENLLVLKPPDRLLSAHTV